MIRYLQIGEGDDAKAYQVTLPATMREVFEYQAVILAYEDGTDAERAEWRQLAFMWASRYVDLPTEVSADVLAHVCAVVCGMCRPPHWVLADLKSRMMLEKGLTKEDELDAFDSAFDGAHLSVSAAAQAAYSATSPEAPSLDLSPWEFEYAKVAAVVRAMQWEQDKNRRSNLDETQRIAAKHGLTPLSS